MRKKLILIYEKLYKAFGPRNWWPGDSPFEVMIGAILTQNTAWGNVEKAIKNLKNERMLSPVKLRDIKFGRLKSLIKPVGFYNVKARRLKHFLNYLSGVYQNNIGKLKRRNLYILRKELLRVNGVGKETADSIMLYALNKPIFVIDAYTRRIFSRHRLTDENADYDSLQKIFMDNLPKKYKLFNEYHALIVELGKTFCKSKKPLCDTCPLKGI